MATVVVVLFSTPSRSSWCTLTLVRASSVRSGRTSLIALTSVVLPAPKPPAMRILNAARGPSAPLSESPEPMQHLPQQLSAGLLASLAAGHYPDPSLLDEVSQQHPDHADRQPGIGGDVGHGGRPLAQLQDPAVLGTERQPVGGLSQAGIHDDRDQVQHLAVSRLGPPARQRVRPHDGVRVPVNPLAARTHRGSIHRDLAGREPWPGGQVGSGPFHQHGHLVGNQAGVGVRRAQDRQAAAVTSGGDEQQGLLQLDDGLAYLPDPEVLARAAGQALHPGGEGGQPLRLIPAQAGGGRDGQAVPGQDHGPSRKCLTRLARSSSSRARSSRPRPPPAPASRLLAVRSGGPRASGQRRRRRIRRLRGLVLASAAPACLQRRREVAGLLRGAAVGRGRPRSPAGARPPGCPQMRRQARLPGTVGRPRRGGAAPLPPKGTAFPVPRRFPVPRCWPRSLPIYIQNY